MVCLVQRNNSVKSYFLLSGGTMDYDGQHLPPELLILLPDSYGISRRNTYLWQASTIDFRNKDKTCESVLCNNISIKKRFY